MRPKEWRRRRDGAVAGHVVFECPRTNSLSIETACLRADSNGRRHDRSIMGSVLCPCRRCLTDNVLVAWRDGETSHRGEFWVKISQRSATVGVVWTAGSLDIGSTLCSKRDLGSVWYIRCCHEVCLLGRVFAARRSTLMLGVGLGSHLDRGF